jgi:dihydroorotate dehydrogenase electron transfer subunit
MLSADAGIDPLLRRPFSIHRVLGQDFKILYRIVGKATHLLKDKSTGHILDMMGPLGNGFPLRNVKRKNILVAGGIGIAPLFYLAESIRDHKPLIFLGARNKEETLGLAQLKSIGIKPLVTTDDGSLGSKGLVTDKLEEFLTDRVSRNNDYCLYACGPKPMLKKLSLIAKKFKLTGYFALEEFMACGLGACLGCVVNTKKGYQRVCKEGPVFSIDEIIW